MKVSNYGISRFENEIRELKEEVKGLKQAECDCSVPLSQGQRRSVIGVFATVVLALTGTFTYSVVNHEQSMNSRYSTLSEQWNDAQPVPQFDSNNWLTCIDGSFTWVYSVGNPVDNGVLSPSSNASGPFTGEQRHAFMTSGPSNC